MMSSDVHKGMCVRVVSKQYAGAFGKVRDIIRSSDTVASVLVEFIAPSIESRWLTSDRLEPTSLLEMLARAAEDDDD